MTKIDFDAIEKEVEERFPKEEYAAAYDKLLHFKSQLRFMRSPVGKKYLSDEFGEIVYLEKVRVMEKTVKSRKVEVEFLKENLE